MSALHGPAYAPPADLAYLLPLPSGPARRHLRRRPAGKPRDASRAHSLALSAREPGPARGRRAVRQRRQELSLHARFAGLPPSLHRVDAHLPQREPSARRSEEEHSRLSPRHAEEPADRTRRVRDSSLPAPAREEAREAALRLAEGAEVPSRQAGPTAKSRPSLASSRRLSRAGSLCVSTPLSDMSTRSISFDKR